MAQGGLFKRPDSPYWWMTFNVAGTNYRESSGTDIKAAARKLRSKRLAEVLLGKGTTGAKGFKVDDMLDHYWEIKKGSTSSNGLESMLAVWAGKLGGRRPASSVSRKDVVEALAQLTKERTLSPATRNRYLAALRAAFNASIANNELNTNPCDKIDNLHETARVRHLTQPEIMSLLGKLTGHVHMMVMAAIHTGARRGELFRLTWNNVYDDQIFIAASKNGDSRHIPVSSGLRIALRQHRMRCGNPSGDTPVFKDVTVDVLRGAFNRALKICNITDFRFHDLRHTFACQMRMAGTDIQTLQKLLGHRKIEMTLRYADVGPEYVRMAQRKMDEAFG